METLNALDIGRGLAIVSVIYGHALAPWVFTATDDSNELAFLQWKLGAAFIMPLFFFLSGLGWRDDKSFASTLRQSLALVLIAVIASAAYDFARLTASLMGVASTLGGQVLTLEGFLSNIVRMILTGDYYSLSSLWFLAALAVVRIIAAIAIRLNTAAAIALVVAVVAVSIAAFDLEWRNIYKIKAVGPALLFFMAGLHWRSMVSAFERRPSGAYALVLLGAAIAALTFDLNQGCRLDPVAQCGAAWLDGRFGVALVHGQIGNLMLFAVTSISGVAAACGLSVLLARSGGLAAQKLSAWGRNSLNLLIVNAGFVHVGSVLVDRWVAPNVEPGPIFFILLFTLTLAANLLAARLVSRPLHWLHRISLAAARRLVEAVTAAPGAVAWVQRTAGVSQRND